MSHLSTHPKVEPCKLAPNQHHPQEQDHHHARRPGVTSRSPVLSPGSRKRQSTNISSSERDLTTDLAGLLPEFRLDVPSDQDADLLKRGGEGSGELFDLDNLPPFPITSMAVGAFFASSSCVLNFLEKADIDRILLEVYSGYGSLLSMCELFAIAAVASHWEPKVSSDYRTRWFETVRHHCDGCVEEDDLRGMRVLTLSGIYLITEKKVQSWSYICDALEIATKRMIPVNQRPDHISEREWSGWRRLWRSLIFLESWLAGSLGRLPVWSAGYHNLALSQAEQTLGDPGIIRANAYQLVLGKIGVLIGNILTDVFVSPSVNVHVVRSYMIKCEYLFDSLPEFMRLSGLLTSQIPLGERNSVFLVHMMYLGAMILLTRRVAVELARGGQISKWKEDGDLEIATGFARTCLMSALQISRILGLQSKEEIFRKCWVTIYCAFNASLILMFHAAQMKHMGLDPSRYSETLDTAATCVSVLEHCAEEDKLAPAYLRLLKPFLAALGEHCPPSPSSASPPDTTSTTPASSFAPIISVTPTASSTPTLSASSATSPDSGTFPYPLSSRSSPESIIAHDVLDIISKPFGGDSTVEPVPQGGKYQFAGDHGRYWKSGDVNTPFPVHSHTSSVPGSLELRWTRPFVGEKPRKRRKSEGSREDAKGRKRVALRRQLK